MRALQFSEFGGPDVLHVADVPEPHAGAGQLRVAVRAVAVNPIDWKVRKGMMEVDLPYTLGDGRRRRRDEVGDGVEGVPWATRSSAPRSGPARPRSRSSKHFAAKPDGLSFEEAAGFVMAARPRPGAGRGRRRPRARCS